jgi:hypothetical protein
MWRIHRVPVLADGHTGPSSSSIILTITSSSTILLANNIIINTNTHGARAQQYHTTPMHTHAHRAQTRQPTAVEGADIATKAM